MLKKCNVKIDIDRFRRTPLLAIAGNKIGAVIGDGTVQGFAVSPLLYAIGQSDALRAATLAMGDNGVIIGLSDDVTIMGEGAGLVEAVKVFKEKSLEANIVFNNKSEILDPINPPVNYRWFRGKICHLLGLNPFADGPKLVKLLGGYLGDPELERQAITESLNESMFDRINTIQSFQCRLQLLIQCTNFIPNYKNRINRPDLGEDFAVKWDDLIMKSVTKCFGYQHNEELTDFTQQRIRSGRNFGGLGLRSLNDHRYPDFTASLCDAIQQIKVRMPKLGAEIADWMETVQTLFDEAMSSNQTMDVVATTRGTSPLQREVAKGVQIVGNNAKAAYVIASQQSIDNVADGIISQPKDIITYKAKKGFKLQAVFTRNLAWVQAKSIMDVLTKPNCPRGDLAAFMSCGGEQASAWILARPSGDTILDNTTISVSLCNRFNTKFLHIYNIPDNTPLIECPCLHSLDTRDAKLTLQHILSCPKYGGLIKRHDGLSRGVQAMLKSCGVESKREVRANAISRMRPDLICPAGALSKKTHILEFAYVNERSKSYTSSKSFKTNGNAARIMAENKTAKYAHTVDPKTQVFQPIICELSGTMNREGLPRLIEFLSAKFSPVAHIVGEDDTPKFTTYWFARFSAWLQICNATAVTRAVTEAKSQGRVPEFPITLHEINEALADNEGSEDGFSDEEDETALEEEV